MQGGLSMSRWRKIVMGIARFIEILGITAFAFPFWYLILYLPFEELPKGFDSETVVEFVNAEAFSYSRAAWRGIGLGLGCAIVGTVLRRAVRLKTDRTPPQEISKG